MNQEQVKETLLSLKIPCPDFTLVFSGKASRRVNGLYRPSETTITIHNKNFRDDNALMFTALHEFTHHIAFTRELVTGSRSHPIIFWALFHSLIGAAMKAGIYTDPYLEDPDLKQRGDEILALMAEENRIRVRLGKALADMHTASEEAGARFDDFLDRHARIPRTQARALAAIQLEFNLDALEDTASPQLIEAIVGCPGTAVTAANMAKNGCSIAQVKASCKQGKVIDPYVDPGEDETAEDRLERLKKRLTTAEGKKERCQDQITILGKEIDLIEKALSPGLFGEEDSQPQKLAV
ncbi:MAG: hypothetical protein WAX33_04320 [Rectinemataceae bacterium]